MEQYHSKYVIIATDIVCYDCLFIARHRRFQGPFLFFQSFLIIPVIVLQRRSYFFDNCVPVNAFFRPSGDGPYRFPKRLLHRMRSSASFFNFLYHIFSLTLRLLMSYIYIYMEHLFLMFLDHTQRRSTVGRTPLDE